MFLRIFLSSATKPLGKRLFFRIAMRQQYLRGEEWLDRGADAGWSDCIGANYEIPITVTRTVRPRCAADDPLCDPTPYQETRTVMLRLTDLNDGIVGKTTQTATKNVDAISVKQADHFAQSNHPSVRAAFDNVFTSKGPAFEVLKKN